MWSIILDLKIPVGGGFGFLKNKRSSIKLSDIPIIVFSGSQDPGLKQQALELDVVSFIQKSTDLEPLMNEVQNILNKTGQ